MLKKLEIVTSLFPTDITKYVSISIYIHKTFVNLLSEKYGFDLIDFFWNSPFCFLIIVPEINT